MVFFSSACIYAQSGALLQKILLFLFHPLTRHQFRKEALLFQQLVIGAVLDDVAPVQHQNIVL